MTQQLDARLNPHAPAVLSLFRIVFGLLFLNHAVLHLFGWPAAAGLPAAPVGSWPYWWAGLLELVTSVLITIGLFTRIAAFFASGIMAFTFFTQHLPNGILPITNGGELAVLYCFGFFLLVFTGGGLYALDSRRRAGVVATTGRRKGWRR
ncbi:DoxX family protein [soil metagenome]